MEQRVYNRAVELHRAIRERKQILSVLRSEDRKKVCCGVKMSDGMIDVMIDVCEREMAEFEKQFEEL